jgi:hypothetical protein
MFCVIVYVITVKWPVIIVCYMRKEGTAVAQWLRYCATNRKAAGSIPDSVIGIFH